MFKIYFIGLKKDLFGLFENRKKNVTETMKMGRKTTSAFPYTRCTFLSIRYLYFTYQLRLEDVIILDVDVLQ